MRIFSTFDTKLKANRISFFQEKYGKSNIHVIERATIFWRIVVFSPILKGILFTSIIWITTWYIFSNNIVLYWSLALATVFSSVFYLSAIKSYIDYIMDYCIITPDEVILTQQEWILKRTVRTLDWEKVKSIYINKQSLIYSIFDSGTIVFMSDGDEEFWEISFDYIKDPESQKDIIQNIMQMNSRQKHIKT